MRSRLNLAISILAAFAVSTLACSGPSSGSGGSVQPASDPDLAMDATLTTKELVRQSKPAIVRIVVAGPAGAAVGTGFFVRSSGVIVTNLHVIVGATEIEIQLLDGSALPLSAVRAYDVPRDLALLQVSGQGEMPTLTLADSDEVEAGDPVIAIGNPLGVFDYTVSDGLVSSVREIDPSLTLLQISAPISQGSSGGPLFNPRGEVIGVVRAFVSEGQNLNFGIPSNYVQALMGRNDGLSLEAFNDRLAAELAELSRKISAAQGGSGSHRQIPEHDLSFLDGCDDESLSEARDEIGNAITVGAPLYNQGNHEACYRIYEGVATRLERESPCQGVRDALGQGLLRANTLSDYTSKAWAMRDAFDGLLHVIARKQTATP